MRFTFNIRVSTSPNGIYWDFITRTVEADNLAEAEPKAKAAAGPSFLALGSHRVEGGAALSTSAEVVPTT